MKRLFVVIMLSVGLLATGCAGGGGQKPEEGAATVTMITAEDAKARLDSEEGLILVDVRTEEEYKEGHIPEAILLPIDTIAEQAETVLPDKEAVYFVYCRSGNRSATASAQLVEMGYQNIHDLGGIIDWPYETVTGQ